jgi:hypothetical protein
MKLQDQYSRGIRSVSGIRQGRIGNKREGVHTCDGVWGSSAKRGGTKIRFADPQSVANGWRQQKKKVMGRMPMRPDPTQIQTVEQPL